MKQSNEVGLFCLKKKTSKKLSNVFRSGILTMLLVFGFQAVQAENLSSDYGIEELQTTISGTVTDADGAPLPGANVVVKGTTNGTQTDFDGNYTIDAGSDAVLVFSYIGFATQEIPVSGQTTIDVQLSEDANRLDEVVIIGYQAQTRGEVTGSVASVDISEAVKTPVVNAAEVLQGRVTGVTVINNTTPGGTPKINVRGFGTSNNTNPLYIIDGIQTDDPNTLNNINPADIEQMNVLKDGAAAIYGARASNGVIIITTKSGGYNMDKAEISVDISTGFSQITNTPGLLNVEQHANMLLQSQLNDGATPGHGQYDPGNTGTFTVPSTINGYTRVQSYNPITFFPAGELTANVQPGGTDWIDELTTTAPTSNISISMQNGTESGKYFMSIGYLTRDGILDYTGFERVSSRLNSEFKINDSLVVGEHLNVSFSDTREGIAESIEMALRSSPLIPVRDNDGLFAGSAGPSLGNSRNPVAQNFRARNDYRRRIQIFGDVYMSYKILDELTFKTTLAGGFNTFDRRQFTALDPENGEPIAVNQLTEQDETFYNWIWTNTLNYRKDFGEHSINALVGIEALKNGGKGKQVSRSDFLFEDPDFYLLNNGAGAPNIDSAFDGFSTLWSVFGTASYDFRDTYFLTATLRRDQSSRFLGDNQSDIFPSFSAGWVMSNEDFFPKDSFINFLKLKGSWGQLGNQTLPQDNPTINISGLSEATANYSFNGSSIITGALLSQVGNPDLRWETSETTNFGVELGLFNSSLSVSAEYFNIKTIDLITQDFGLISTTAIDAAAPLVNLGDVKNTGFDLAIGYSNQTDSGFSYGIDVNISHYKNTVERLIDGTPVGGRTNNLRDQQPTLTEEGDELSFFFGRKVVGFTDEGRFAYEDVDGDGVTVGDDDDRTKIGSPHPDFTYGINLNAAYKGFDLSLFFNGSQGNDIYNFNKFYTDFPAFVNGNRSTRVLDSWTPENTNATLPALSTTIQNNEGDPNSYYVEDGSFLRLRNAQIGYTLPQNVSDKIGMSSLRLYIQGSNLFTITGYEGFDPEIISNDNLSLGIDNRIFPLARIFTLGANIKF